MNGRNLSCEKQDVICDHCIVNSSILLTMEKSAEKSVIWVMILFTIATRLG